MVQIFLHAQNDLQPPRRVDTGRSNLIRCDSLSRPPRSAAQLLPGCLSWPHSLPAAPLLLLCSDMVQEPAITTDFKLLTLWSTAWHNKIWRRKKKLEHKTIFLCNLLDPMLSDPPGKRSHQCLKKLSHHSCVIATLRHVRSHAQGRIVSHCTAQLDEGHDRFTGRAALQSRGEGEHRWSDCNGPREISDGFFRAPLAEVDVAQVGVGTGAVRLLLQYYLEEALGILPSLLCCCPHSCIGNKIAG